ncbi:MAG: hypothetical protein M1824_003384 [Vezdaea acicularis]|nr:MAG: hypothetical protein M1824_003384 [Vezdaea acicularis]
MSSNQRILGGSSTVNSARAAGDTASANRNSILPEDSLLSRARQAFSTLHSFEDSLKNMAKHSQVFSDVEKAVERLGTMELDIQKKDKRIADLESAYEVEIEKFSQQVIKWNQEKSQLEKKLADEKAAWKTKAESVAERQHAKHIQSKENLNKELAKEKKSVATLKGQLEKETAKTRDLDSKLNGCVNRLKGWDGYLSAMSDVDFNSFESRIRKIFDRCRKIAHTHFFRDLPANAFADEVRWDTQTRLLKVPLSFPPSNSPPAKLVRMATCLHTIASHLSTNIFRPCYIPESIVASEAVKEILSRQFSEDSKMELLTRALLLSTYDSEDVDAATKEAVFTASEDTFQLLSPIGGDQTFRLEVEKLFQEAADVWKLAQRSRKMVEVFTLQQYPNWTWEHLQDFGGAVAETNVQVLIHEFEMLNLFPAIFIPEENRGIYPGSVLWHDQKTVLEADRELRECITARKSKSGRSGTVSGGPGRRERKPSIVSSARNGVTGLLRSNSGAEDATPFLGTQRVQPQGSQGQNRNGGEG